MDEQKLEKEQTTPELSKEELDANLAAPVNAAVAASILLDGSPADADADQEAPIDQSNSTEGPLRRPEER